jgi:hypothetical protein
VPRSGRATGFWPTTWTDTWRCAEEPRPTAKLDRRSFRHDADLAEATTSAYVTWFFRVEVDKLEFSNSEIDPNSALVGRVTEDEGAERRPSTKGTSTPGVLRPSR